MPDWKSAFGHPRRIATAVIAFGGLAIFLINYPGSMEFDSFVQLVEARSEQYTNWHPAVMSWLLGVYDGLPGPVAAWFTGFDMLLAFGALIAFLQLPARVCWAAVVLAALLLLLPQFVLTQAVVWKDTLFADTVLAAFVCLAFVGRTRGIWRLALVAMATALIVLAVLTRQNGVVVLPCAAVAVAAIVRKSGQPRRAAAVWGITMFVAAIAATAGASMLLQIRADPYDGRREMIKVLQLYDITGIMHRDASVTVPILDREAPETARLLHTQSVPRWSPVKNDTMLSDEMIAALETTPPGVMRRQWLATITQHPADYLALRAVLFRWVFQAPDVWLCHPIHVGDEGDPDDFKELGMGPRLDARDMALADYGYAFKRTPFFSHALYALIGVLVTVLLLRRRTPSDIALAALVVSSLLFAATFYLVSIACDYRYLTVIDLAALTGLLYAVADWPALKPYLRRQKRRGPEGPPE